MIWLSVSVVRSSLFFSNMIRINKTLAHFHHSFPHDVYKLSYPSMFLVCHRFDIGNKQNVIRNSVYIHIYALTFDEYWLFKQTKQKKLTKITNRNLMFGLLLLLLLSSSCSSFYWQLLICLYQQLKPWANLWQIVLVRLIVCRVIHHYQVMLHRFDWS